jgi:hypothetical protein
MILLFLQRKFNMGGKSGIGSVVGNTAGGIMQASGGLLGMGQEGGLLGTGVFGKPAQVAGFQMTPEAKKAEADLIKRQQDIAQGKLPSQALNQATQAAMATAASARGVANPALAQRAAMQQVTQEGLDQAMAQRAQADQLLAAQTAAQRGVAFNQAAQNVNAQQAQNQTNAGFISGIGNMAAAKSDENAKMNIESASEDLKKFAQSLKGYNFNYKNPSDGVGDQTGVMAQDLEKSKVGSQAVMDTPDGKMVDYAKLMPAMLATIAEQEKRIKKMEG